MTEQYSALLTNSQLEAAPEDKRVEMVEAFLLASISALKPDMTETIAGSCRLSDLGIDSLELVELKFGLDQVLGHEIDVELIITNPTLSELASSSLREAGL